jgi:ArsR family transcriptional regulator
MSGNAERSIAIMGCGDDMHSAQGHVAKLFRVLGDDTRLQILALLRIREACVCELVELFGISQPAISEHLRRLREAGLVEDERRGMWVFYRRAAQIPAFVHAALEAVDVPAELAVRLRAMTPAGACARADAPARPAATVTR